MRIYQRRHMSSKEVQDDLLEYDDVIIGSGAGGGHLSYLLSQSERRVLIIEKGPLLLSPDFSTNEIQTYKNLYKDQLAQSSKDNLIKILQGSAVGGSTTINWTTCFRTPESTLKVWRDQYGISLNLKEDFENIELMYSIKEWDQPINSNNGALKSLCESNNWSHGIISRNVEGCANTGRCGLGCPVNAKRGTLINTIPKALKNGVDLISELEVTRLVYQGDQINMVHCQTKLGKEIKVRAKRFFLCAGAIATPGLMLKSNLIDPYKLIGTRTFLHPTLISGAKYKNPINGAHGAPQSIYSNHFLEDGFTKETMGFKLEVGPTHPVIFSNISDSYGDEHAQFMKARSHISAQLILLRDGFHPESPGGKVELNSFNKAILDYPKTQYFLNSAKESFKTLVRAQLESQEIEEVLPGIINAGPITKMRQLDHLLEDPKMIKVFSAHVMGGTRMGVDEKNSVVNLKGQSHYYENLFVMDGSLFPTSIGANPMQSILSMVNHLAKNL